MTDTSCTYGSDRDEALVAFLYDDGDGSPAQRARFEAHLRSCAHCQAEVAGLQGVRSQLAHWSPPTFGNQSSVVSRQSNQQAAINNQQWWRQVPAWAQVAAALLFLGVSLGIANLNVRYDQAGLTVRTGWSDRSGGSSESARSGGSSGSGRSGESGGSAVAQGFSPANTSAPWKADLSALESELKSQIRATQAAAPAARMAQAVSAPADADLMRRLRALVEESEKRQQRELALRIAELLRDVNTQRQADLVKIDRTLGVVQNSVGIEVMKNRQQLNQMDLLYRASQRQ